MHCLFNVLTVGRTRKFMPQPWKKRGGGWGVDGTPPLNLLICCSLSTRFCLQWKNFDRLNKMRHVLWVVALLEACDVTNNGRHLGCHLVFYQELEIRLKLR